jgi:small subunit ribosomal protein S6
MTLPAPTYDLVLLLDPQAEEATRAKILTDARAAIEAQGEFLRQDDWGDRTLTYPIDRKADAEYHLLQFHAGTPEMLSALDRTLRITDGIMRFRIIKLKPGVPEAPDVLAAPAEEAHSEPPVAVEAVAVAETGADVEVEVVEAEVEVVEVVEAEVVEAEVEVVDDKVGEPEVVDDEVGEPA